jgi:thiol:disulfide interchange protein DsbD
VAGLYLLGGSMVHSGLFGKSLVAAHPGAGQSALVQEPVAADPAVAAARTTVELPDHVPWQVIRTGEGVQAFLDEQRELARTAGKPVLIDFWATWCIYCKKLDKVTWNDPAVVEESLRFVPIKIDATDPDDEEMTRIKEEFKVPGLPRVIFIDSRGEILHGRTSAFKPADEMLALMKTVR